MNAAVQQAAQRFPLIARPRPACPPLRQRIAELRDLSDAASQGSEPSHLTLAAEVLNKAALIASDCGVPALARSLCWRHFAAYLPAWPLNAPQARHALEPLVNLARLAIREHDGTHGYLLLHSLFQSASTGGATDIDGHHIPFDGLTRTDHDLYIVRKWLWGVFLAEGIRALISASKWDQAVAHARQYRGIGRRLLDGRQTTIIAHCLAGQPDTALKLLADSEPVQPWEHPVADCLEALCSHASGRSVGGTVTEAQRRFLELDQAPGLLVFRTRLGLTILDLITDTDWPLAERVFTPLIRGALAGADGYVAREVLAHTRTSALLSLAEQKELTSAVENAGLGLGAIPALLMAKLHSAVQTSETVIREGLDAGVSPRSGSTVPSGFPRSSQHT